jgi:methionyl-tRNA synthetase
MSEYFLDGFIKAGAVSLDETMQFYDEKFGTFLNGRQVIGKCPIDGCSSEKGYADGEDMGLQY